jgi:hypothetical protein
MSENANGLGELISATVVKQLDAAFVEKEVEGRVSKLVVEAVDRALRGYSETAKLIEKAVEDALRVEKLDLPSYGITVAAILKTQIEAKVSDLVAGTLAKEMDELLSLAPKSVKLSEIAKEMIECRHSDGSYGEVITVIVEHADRGYSHIYLDEEEVIEPREKYRCQHRLAIDPDGKIYAATIANQDLKKATRFGHFYNIDQKLRAYVACGTKIILDEDDVVTSMGDY